MNRDIPWKTKMSQEEGFVIIGEPFSGHARKARSITNTKIFCDMFNKLLITSAGQAEFDDLLAVLTDSAPGPDGIPYGVYKCAGGLGSSFVLIKLYWKEVLFLIVLWKVRPSLSLRLLMLMTLEGSSDLLTHFARWLSAIAIANSLTSAICRGLHWYTVQCIHTSHRCISSRQMTDNILEIETTALAHDACVPQDSGVLSTDFAAASPSVNHSWIFSVLENTGCLSLSLSAKYLKGQHHTRGICGSRTRTIPYGPASGFLFAMAFDPIFRWLQESIIPRNLYNLDFLQPAQCAYADGLAVASSSFRELMSALAASFHSVVYIAGLNCKVSYMLFGSVWQRRTWFSEDVISENCEEFSEMQIVRHAQICWNNDWPWWLPSSLDCRKKCATRDEILLLPKVWLSGCVNSRSTRW